MKQSNTNNNMKRKKLKIILTTVNPLSVPGPDAAGF
jgi:hypothetical protein